MQVVRNLNWMTLVALLVMALMSAGCAGGASAGSGSPLSFHPSGSDGTSGSTDNNVDPGATTVGTGGGGGNTSGGSLDTDLHLPGGSGTGTATGGSAYSPAITVPPVESFANNANPGEDDVTAWLKNCFETLPQGGNVYQNASLQAWADAVFDAVNVARRQNGLGPVEREDHLDALAQSHARDMGLRDYFAHDCPDGVLMWDRWLAMRIPYCNWAGENAAMGQESAQEVVNQWLNSPGHRKNMLHDSAEYAGVGVYFDTSDRDMPVKVIMEYADFRDSVTTNDWYQFGDVYR
jgi:uncharacterized protein YkwD